MTASSPSDPASLDRLNDIVDGDPIGVFPLAVGWNVLIAVGLAWTGYLAYRAVRNWQARAYRRQALRDLATADHPETVAELVRRCAIAGSGRQGIIPLTGQSWTDWLDEHRGDGPAMDSVTKADWIDGPYRAQDVAGTLDRMKSYAQRWIEGHRC